MAVDRLAGVLAPVLTPMRADLAPDVEKWIAFSRQLLADGCTGLAPFGTTSEANSLGLSERMEMLDQLVAAGVPAAKLMPGVGMCAGKKIRCSISTITFAMLHCQSRVTSRP